MTDTELKCRNAKEAAKKLSTASANDKNKALLLIAEVTRIIFSAKTIRI